MAHNAYTFRYRVRNWRTYNQALIDRGGITFWIDEALLVTWRNSQACRGPGAPKVYSDTTIHCTVVVKSVYGLSLRAAQGFVSSVMSFMRLDLPVPNNSTICRRQSTLRTPFSSSSYGRSRHIVIDATGLRVYGAGEWHVQKHGSGRRRTWRKLHLGVDERTKEIVATEITTSHVHDSQVLSALLSQVTSEIAQVSGDGAYDTANCYRAIGRRGARATIPVRRNARRRERGDNPEWCTIRNENLREIEQRGRYEWRVSSGCTWQSLVENAMSRFKAIFGPRLRARRFDNQRTEGLIKCDILNRMTSLGMPVSERLH